MFSVFRPTYVSQSYNPTTSPSASEIPVLTRVGRRFTNQKAAEALAKRVAGQVRDSFSSRLVADFHGHPV